MEERNARPFDVGTRMSLALFAVSKTSVKETPSWWLCWMKSLVRIQKKIQVDNLHRIFIYFEFEAMHRGLLCARNTALVNIAS